MDRRTFLTASGAALTLPLVGCAETEPDSGTPTPTDSPVPAPDLLVVNYTPTTELATVRVVDADGTAVVDGRYELPSERGIEFEGVGAWERSYTVELTIDDTDLGPVTWATDSCTGNDQAPRGSRDGYVQVREDGDGLRATIAVDNCDEIVGPEYPTGPAEGFRVEE